MGSKSGLHPNVDQEILGWLVKGHMSGGVGVGLQLGYALSLCLLMQGLAWVTISGLVSPFQ